MTALEEPILPTSVAWGLLAAFSVLWVALGAWLGRRNYTAADHMLAGRNVGLALASATAMATWVTANTTMTAPQLALELGVWGMLGYSLGALGLILFAPMARRIRELMPHGFTSGDFIRLRYGTFTWRVFLGVSLIYAFGWLISMAMAGGVLINALAGIDYRVGMTVILTVCVIYTLLGGLRAVIGTDFIQTVIIIAGAAFLAWMTIDRVGFEAIHFDLMEERPELLSLLFPAAIMFLFNNLLFGVGEIFHSNVWWSRAFAFGRNVGFRAYLLGGLLWLPIPIVAGFVALATPALGINVPAADMVGPLVAAEVLGLTGAIVVFIVVFAALASSLDSLLAATSDLVTRDIYRGHIRPQASEQAQLRATKIIVVLLGLLTWLAASYRGEVPVVGSLAALLYFTGAFVASAIWPIVAGLYWRRANPQAAAWAMLLGSGLGLASYFMIGWYVAALVGAAVSLVVMVAGTWLFPRPFDWDRLAHDDRDTSPGRGNPEVAT
ncbi:sodium:solute symporter family protein [Thioalkalivibrio sp. ALR17-21]|uniref:sodium:solute symporter family protein n=1 Tax=Thioalkalivibrio sp. ALR17-21 TaxID=1269813 RepID=UPI0003F5D579|nr:sodium:solute symporter family protein [Thioalkalivibrio sp. ALR17-21]